VALKLEVTAESNTALEDVRDRFVQLILRYDEVLENATGLMNSYHSINAQKNNDVMKMLTVFSAFFLPLTFLAGIYGMNFTHMPELQWENGYYAVLAFMVVMCILIYVWFRRKKIL
jgi:magnesium transporter